MQKRTKNGNGWREHVASLRVGFFLAVRQVRRTSPWTNVLVVCVMTLTFLNLVVVGGILVGLIEGMVETVGAHYLGDIFISNLEQKAYIEQSPAVIGIAERLPGAEILTARYLESGTVEANYKTKKRTTDLGEVVGTSIVGINPEAEEAATNLSKFVVEGEYLDADDYDQVLLGAMLLRKYMDFELSSFPTLKNVEIGSRVRVTVGGNVREVTVKGIVKSKIDELDRRVFFVDKQLRTLIGRFDYNVDEITLKLAPGTDSISVKESLLSSGVGKYAKVQTREDAEPKFVKDIKKTFRILGNIISSIGLVVAAITIFIVIFINAITRRKFIGILKGIGVRALAIEYAYVFQSVFYAVVGTAAGIAIVFGLLKPYFAAHPIDFPFSDGILVATIPDTLAKVAILLIATLVAGYVPAKLVTRQNTLDAILNR